VQEARIHRQSGDVRSALELLAGLSASERADAAVAEEMAAAYTARGEHERAAAAWDHRFRSPQGGHDYRAAVKAGESMLRAGRPDEAVRWLRAAQVAGGNAPEVRELEARIRDAGR
jgi:thioredoxin-like negative regulator of GroEL